MTILPPQYPGPDFTHGFLTGEGTLEDINAIAPIQWYLPTATISTNYASAVTSGAISNTDQVVGSGFKRFRDGIGIEDTGGTKRIKITHSGVLGNIELEGGGEIYHQSTERFLSQTAFNNVAPTSTTAPTLANHLTTKAYVDSIIPSPTALKICFVRDEKSSGTHGGSSWTGSWGTRDLNTVLGDSTVLVGGVVTSNQFTLAGGKTYYVQASVPTFRTDSGPARLRNVTDSTTTIIGSNAHSDDGDYCQDESFINGTFTLAANKTFEIQQQFRYAVANEGLGRASGYQTEVYTQVTIMEL
jgi:hypothetical protein